ncbi:flippase [Thomasclavelia cocleata]|uniref:flippase n=1 Tax=Thomasclavelia cocleata TaxID=69824 RepID=UPI00272DEA23|nr:flippase [Thomasclavelia cocleata]
MDVKKNIIYNTTYQILILLLPLVTTPYISRVIGADGIGIYSYNYSIVNYFMLFALLGLNNYGNRSIAAVRDDKVQLSETFFNIYGLQVLTSGVMILLYLGYITCFLSDYRLIAYIQLIFIISTMLDINWFFFGLEQFKLTVIRNTIVKILTVIAIFMFVKKPTDLWIYTIIMSVGTLISQLMVWPFIKKYIIWVRPNLKGILTHLKPNLTLFVPVLAISIYKIMDKIMLGSLTTTLQVGYYENSEKLINIPLSIITALGTVMLPRMTNLVANNKSDAFKTYINISLKFVMFIAIGSMVGLTAISSNFIPFFLGDEFIDCISVVSLLSVTILFVSWANVIRTQYLIPRQRDKIYIISTLLGAGVNVIANFIFIPFYGAAGAAIGTIFAEASVAIYQTFKVRKELEIKKYFVNSCKYIIPAICMYLCIKLLRDCTENIAITLIIQIILGGLVYIALCGCSLFILDKKFRFRVQEGREG